nr:EOG090X07E6 [Macrothrix elegans]
MAAYLTCQSLSGLPLFIRRKGDIAPIPFPIVASLNGVHTYTKSQGAELDHTSLENISVVWKEYHDSLVLCLAATDTALTTDHLKQTLDMVFHAMVFYLGLEDLTSLKNIERLKKDLRICYPLIDTVLDSLNPREDWEDFCDLTQCTDMFSCPEKPTFEGILNCFAESVGTVFGCLRINGKISAATSNWWTLDCVELIQIQLLLSKEKYDTGLDIPIYLPVRSPKVPFRLVQWKLTQNTDVCLLCGPTPSLFDLQKEVKRFWRTAFALIKSAESCYPANIPNDIVLDKNILSYLLINLEKHRSISSLAPHASSKDVHSHLTSVRKRDILRTCYRTVMGSMIQLDGSNGNQNTNDSKEVFMNFEYYTVHALVFDSYGFLVLYPSGLHNYYLRSISRSALKILTSDKFCKW